MESWTVQNIKIGWFCFIFPVRNSGREVSFLLYYYYFFSPGIFFPELPSASTFWYNKVHFCRIWILYLSSPLACISNDFNLSSVWSVSFLYLAMKRYYLLCHWLVKFTQRTCAKWIAREDKVYPATGYNCCPLPNRTHQAEKGPELSLSPLSHWAFSSK